MIGKKQLIRSIFIISLLIIISFIYLQRDNQAKFFIIGTAYAGDGERNYDASLYWRIQKLKDEVHGILRSAEEKWPGYGIQIVGEAVGRSVQWLFLIGILYLIIKIVVRKTE